ncbi:beta-L-arabinofuranosidase domain-containing protein [Telluribacter humicola]|uniref:beta-L-arabinofuranosidase domain-containing protein n=1 Tax=Telluribacter humicola TaxID=1720261 RepID=UPI001A96340B|nr:beta-L-arabinofuranosidase domain-containing protein [Telluribacter humicola]
MKSLSLAATLLLLTSFTSGPQKPGTAGKQAGDEAYTKPVFIELPLGAVKPTGWLRNQLMIMQKGTTGHLDEVHAKISKDNGWLGGKGDGWEETPYWLDGAVPLAYLLDSKPLQEKVLKYINWTLDHQRPSGYFGPITKAEREQGVQITADNCEQGEDWWPKMIMLKVLQQYYTATQDPRVIPFMTKYFHYQLQSLKKCPVGKWTEWATSRGTDNAMMAQWLYSITKDRSLLELASLIEAQSFPWSTWLGNRDWAIGAATNQNSQNWMHRHAVNVGMALKAPAINYQRTNDEAYLKALKTGFNDLMTLHGLPMGIFSGDEDLHGNDPTQGVELCAIVESMFSLEKIISITGDIHYMDALERMTFNALPTQTTDDFNAKQYFQIANQVQVSRGVFDFSLPFDREMNNVFGMRSGYTCCLANMHQGWTKFAQHLWYTTPGKGLAALAYAPNQLKAKVGSDNTEITINEVTNYPFDDVIHFEINTPKAVAFPFQLRIPAWCKEATVTVNGKKISTVKGGQLYTHHQTWKNGDKLTLHLPMEVTTSNWAKNSRTIERGPLVYALRLEEQWEEGHNEAEGQYYSIYPKGDWNYGLVEQVIKEPLKNVQVTTRPITDSFVWNIHNAPIELKTTARKIPGWQLVDGLARQPVTDRNGLYKGKVSDATETITLIPYGCTKVRIVAFPVVR